MVRNVCMVVVIEIIADQGLNKNVTLQDVYSSSYSIVISLKKKPDIWSPKSIVKLKFSYDTDT